MAKRQLGPGGPIYDYDGIGALDAPHTNLSKLKVVKVNVDIGAHTANVPLRTSVTLPTGTCSARAAVIAVQPDIGSGNAEIEHASVSAADTIILVSRASDTTNPAAQDFEFWIIDP